MGLSTKQVAGDQGVVDQTRLQSGAAELSKPPSTRRQQPLQQPSEPLKCPRCDSANTKFCYYNNYNKSQPRHFCKSCKRHWTKGGTLRNVPVGGGRKNKRPKISTPPTTTVFTSAAAATKTVAPTTSASHCQNITSDHQKSMSNILYQALINRSAPPLLNNSTSTAAQNPNPEIFPLFSNFDVNASLINIPTNSYHQPSITAYDQNLDSSVEESTVTTVNVPNMSPLPWQVSEMDFSSSSNYWSWNEIDALTSSDDHLNLAWDEDQDFGDGIKFKP